MQQRIVLGITLKALVDTSEQELHDPLEFYTFYFDNLSEKAVETDVHVCEGTGYSINEVAKLTSNMFFL